MSGSKFSEKYIEINDVHEKKVVGPAVILLSYLQRMDRFSGSFGEIYKGSGDNGSVSPETKKKMIEESLREMGRMMDNRSVPSNETLPRAVTNSLLPNVSRYMEIMRKYSGEFDLRSKIGKNFSELFSDVLNGLEEMRNVLKDPELKWEDPGVILEEGDLDIDKTYPC